MVSMRRIGATVLLLGCVSLAMTACGAAHAAGRHGSASVSPPGAASAAELVVVRSTAVGSSAAATYTVTAPAQIAAVAGDLRSLPAQQPCAPVACVVACPFDSGLRFHLVVTQDNRVTQVADVEPTGCRSATLQPGGARVVPAGSHLWDDLAAALHMPLCDLLWAPAQAQPTMIAC